MQHYVTAALVLARDLRGTAYEAHAAALTAVPPATVEEAKAVTSTLLRLLARADQEPRGRPAMSATLVLTAALADARDLDELAALAEARALLATLTRDPHTRAGAAGQIVAVHRSRPDILGRLITGGAFSAETAAALAAEGGALVGEVCAILRAGQAAAAD